jgi:ABC-2 type transport system ATP-binding protein
MSRRLSFESVSCLLGLRRATVAALQDFSLRCEAGEAMCLIGPNGAGKSTALALAAGLLPATSGRITFDDSPVSSLAPPRRVGYLPQVSSFPLRLTVGEVLEFTAAARGTGAAALRRSLVSSGFEPLRGQAVGALSSGWLRRLGLAVALMPPSDLLLLDEPFVGLDLETLDAIVEEIGRRVAHGVTVLLCSHDFEVVDRLGGRVAVLDEGRLLEATAIGEAGARAVYRRALTGKACTSESSRPGRRRGDSDGEEGSGLYAVAG